MSCTVPCAEPHYVSYSLDSYSSKNHLIYFSICDWVSKLAFCVQLSCACYIPHLSGPPSFNDLNTYWRRAKNMSLITAQLHPPSCYFLLLLCAYIYVCIHTYTYTAHCTLLDKHPPSTLLTLAKRQFSHPYKAVGELCGSTAYCVFSFRV